MCRKLVISLFTVLISLVLITGSIAAMADEGDMSGIYTDDGGNGYIDDLVIDDPGYVDPYIDPEPYTEPEPVTQEPATQEPVTAGDQPIYDPGMDDPGIDDPGMDDPGMDDPGMDDPGMDDPGMDDPGNNDPGQNNQDQNVNIPDNNNTYIPADDAQTNNDAQDRQDDEDDNDDAANEIFEEAVEFYADEDVYIGAFADDPEKWPDNVVMTARRISADNGALLDAMNDGSEDIPAEYTDENTWLYSINFFIEETDDEGNPSGNYSVYLPEEGSVSILWQFRRNQLTSAFGAESANDIGVVTVALDGTAVSINDDGTIDTGTVTPEAVKVYGNAGAAVDLYTQTVKINEGIISMQPIPGTDAFFAAAGDTEDSNDSGKENSQVMVYAVTSVTDADRLITPVTVKAQNDAGGLIPEGYYLMSAVRGITEDTTTLAGTYYNLKPLDEAFSDGVTYGRDQADIQLTEDYVYAGGNEIAENPGFSNAVQTFFIIKSTDGSGLTAETITEDDSYEIMGEGDAIGDYVIREISLENGVAVIILDTEGRIGDAAAEVAGAEAVAEAETETAAETETGKETEAEAETEKENNQETKTGIETETTTAAQSKAETTAAKAVSNAVQFAGQLTLTGRKINIEDEFCFVIIENNLAVAFAYSNTEGKIEFPSISYTSEDIGVHVYTVKEVLQDGQGLTSDDTEYTVQVNVTDAGNGQVNAEVAGGDDASLLNFANTYVAEGEIIIGGTDFLNGQYGEDDIVTFSIEPVSEGAPVPEKSEVTVDGKDNDGRFSFGTLRFTNEDLDGEAEEKTFEYKVTGTVNSPDNVKGKTESRKMSVVVRDNQAGKLSVSFAEDSDENLKTIRTTTVSETESRIENKMVSRMQKMLDKYGAYVAIGLVVVLIIIIIVVIKKK